MEFAALLIVLLAFGRGPSAPATPQTSGAGAGGGDGKPPGGTVAGTIGTAAGTLGALGSGGAVAGGGGAAGTAAGGTAAGTTASGTAGGTAGSSGTASTATATATATTTAGTVGGATNGAIAVTNAAGEVIGAVSAGSAGGVAIIVAVVMAFIVAKRVADAQEIDKDWQGYLLGLQPNGRGLVDLESLMVEGMMRTPVTPPRNGAVPPPPRTWTVKAVRDFRCDRVLPGSRVLIQGWRNVYGFLPAPGEVDTFRRVRALVLEYLRLRAGHGYRMIRNWNVLTPPANWGSWPDYNSVLPGIGGLGSIPHAARGGTIAPRSCPDSEDVRDPLEAISDEQYTNVQGITLTEPELQAARLLALIDAVRVLKFDPRPAIEADRHFYAGEVLRALSWNGDPPPGVSVSGEALELDPAVYGAHRFLWPARRKLNESDWVTA